MTIKNKNYLSLSVIGTSIVLLLITFSAEAARRGPPGKVPRLYSYENKNNPQSQFMDLYETIASNLTGNDLGKAKETAASLADLATEKGRSDIANAASNVATATSLSGARDAVEVLGDSLDGNKTMHRKMVGNKRHRPSKFK